MSDFGFNGRLSNQLFQFASLIGLSEKYNQQLVMPEWRYARYFQGNYPLMKPSTPFGSKLEEKNFHYNEYPELASGNHDLKGYYQSQKYWAHCEEKVKDALKWDSEFEKSIREKYSNLFDKEVIAIHIRRGDYVGNSNYFQLPISYYLTALELIHGWKERPILILSDDIEYCKIHFESFDNVVFANGNEIEDMCAGSLCNDFILSNSSYSWWLCYLARNCWAVPIRPDVHFDGNLLKTCDIKDFWLPNYQIHSVHGTHTYAQS